MLPGQLELPLDNKRTIPSVAALKALQDRYTVLDHNPWRTATVGSPFFDRDTAKGVVPESWLCVDCGANTAPGMKTRKEWDADLIIHGVVEQALSWEQEVYTVTKEVWAATGLEGMGGCLCISCLEKRIGRRLKPKNFLPDHPFNAPGFPATRRLRRRRGGG